MFKEITEAWPILAIIAGVFVIAGISALITKRVRWERFKASVLAFVWACSFITPGVDLSETKQAALILLSKCQNRLHMPVNKKIVALGGYNYVEFAFSSLILYARQADNSELLELFRSHREAAIESTRTDLP